MKISKKSLPVLAAVIGIAIAIPNLPLHMMLPAKITYHVAQTLDVTAFQTTSVANRTVNVALNGRQIRLYTTDRLNWPEPNTPSCVAERRVLFGMFTKYTLALDGYCPALRR